MKDKTSEIYYNNIKLKLDYALDKLKQIEVGNI